MTRQQLTTGWLVALLVCVSCQSSPDPLPSPPIDSGTQPPLAPELVDVFVSAYGFSMDVPSEWSPLTDENVLELLELGKLEKANEFAQLSPQARASFAEALKRGIEFLMNFQTADAAFMDNINVMKLPGSIPSSVRGIAASCRSLPGQLSTAYGRCISPPL